MASTVTRFLVAAVLAVLVIAGVCRIGEAATSANYLTGHGNSSVLAMDITMAASRDTNNTVRGEVVVAGGYQGNVTELVEPAGAIDYWCVNVDVEGLEIHSIMFFRDQISGDEFSFTNGIGLDCSNTTPGIGSFESIDSGDFVGEVVADTCATDLAQCQSDLTAANSALATCNANLSQCQADLANCTAVCELPLLPPNYDAKLTGAGLYDQLNTKVKISATRKATGEVTGNTSATGLWKASVTQVFAPYDGRAYWCVNSAIYSSTTPGDIGSNVVLFVKDTGKGCDPVSYAIGPGLDCNIAVPTLAFSAISTGDFKGQLRCGDKQCCPN